MSEVVDGPRIQTHEGGQQDLMPAPELAGLEKAVASSTGGKDTAGEFRYMKHEAHFIKFFLSKNVLIPIYFYALLSPDPSLNQIRVTWQALPPLPLVLRFERDA